MLNQSLCHFERTHHGCNVLKCHSGSLNDGVVVERLTDCFIFQPFLRQPFVAQATAWCLIHRKREGWREVLNQPLHRPALVCDDAGQPVQKKTRAPAPPPPMQPLDWPSKPWEHLQLDVCGELRGVPHHLLFWWSPMTSTPSGQRCHQWAQLQPRC